MTTQAQIDALKATTSTLSTQVNALTPDVGPPPSPSTMPAPPGYTTKWLEDSFVGNVLNGQLWNTWYGPGVRWDVKNLGAPYSSGGSNQAAYWAPGQISVNSGLTLTARKTQPGDVGYGKLGWVSGCLTSKNSLPSSGCYVQVKAKRPDSSSGMWWADWLLPLSSEQELDGGEGGWPGSAPNQLGHSDTWAGTGQVQRVWQTGVDLSAAYHVYGYQFIPGANGSFTVFFDGKQVYQFLGHLSLEDYYLFLQLQVYSGASGNWHTLIGPTTPNPALSQYAEVQVWTP